MFYDKLTFIYLEMPKFNKTEEDLDGMFEKWLFVLRNLSRLLERPQALQERVFTKLFEAAEIAKFTKTEYEAYEESLKVYRDWQNTIRTAINKGLAEGREKGLAEGLAEGMEKGLAEGMEKGLAEGMEKGMEKGKSEEKRAIAHNLKALGLTSEQIQAATGLSAREIDQL